LLNSFKLYEKFTATIWENPLILAEALGDNKVIAKYDLDEIVHGLLFCLYGNFYPPKEEQAVLQIIEVTFPSPFPSPFPVANEKSKAMPL
jgi:hypothetical protein